LRAARKGASLLRCTFNAEDTCFEWAEQQLDGFKLKEKDRFVLRRGVGANIALEGATSSACEYVVRMVDRSKRIVFIDDSPTERPLPLDVDVGEWRLDRCHEWLACQLLEVLANCFES
jgi:hypothetical protein